MSNAAITRDAVATTADDNDEEYETIELSAIAHKPHEDKIDSELHDGAPTLLPGAVRRSPSFTERIINATSRSTSAVANAAMRVSGRESSGSSYAAPILLTNEGEEEQQDPDALGWTTILLSSLLCFGGTSLFISGPIIFFHSDEPRGLDMFILGGLMLLPGAYGAYLLIKRTIQLCRLHHRRAQYRRRSSSSNTPIGRGAVAEHIRRPGLRLLENIEA